MTIGIPLWLVLPCPVARGDPPHRVAVFDFEFVNTSPAATTAVETARVARIGDALRAGLERSGRYHAIGTKQVQEAARRLPSLRDCHGCERDAARDVGAELAAYGWIQKVSNLILNINVVIEDVATGRHVAVGSVDIRGNTDDSWDHGLRFLLADRLLAD